MTQIWRIGVSVLLPSFSERGGRFFWFGNEIILSFIRGFDLEIQAVHIVYIRHWKKITIRLALAFLGLKRFAPLVFTYRKTKVGLVNFEGSLRELALGAALNPGSDKQILEMMRQIEEEAASDQVEALIKVHSTIMVDKYKANAQLPSVEFLRICQGLTTAGNNVIFTVTPKGSLHMVTLGRWSQVTIVREVGISRLEKQGDSFDLLMKEPLSKPFFVPASLKKYLPFIAAASSLSKTVNIYLSPDLPVLLVYKIGDRGFVTHCLSAPDTDRV